MKVFWRRELPYFSQTAILSSNKTKRRRETMIEGNGYRFLVALPDSELGTDAMAYQLRQGSVGFGPMISVPIP